MPGTLTARRLFGKNQIKQNISNYQQDLLVSSCSCLLIIQLHNQQMGNILDCMANCRNSICNIKDSHGRKISFVSFGMFFLKRNCHKTP